MSTYSVTSALWHSENSGRITGIQAYNKVPIIPDATRPFLRILEQPQTHYKFRYITEMDSSHGCLYGKSYDKNKSDKIYPEVELVNYGGRAKIICTLVEDDSSEEHPHTFHANQQNQELFVEVPEKDSYTVCFPGLCIVQREVKKVPEWLFKRHDIGGLSERDIIKLKKECSIAAKKINLNVVRLKFSARNAITNEEICAPVISEPINNLKHAATTILKICKMSRCHGRAQGGDDVILLVERVIKKNIRIRFYELSEDGTEIWNAFGQFIDSDVHHQYAISFRTPPCRDINTTKKLSVYVELLRPSDGQTSKPIEFFYTPEPFSKKRKFNHCFETPPRTPSQSNNTYGQATMNDDVRMRQTPTSYALEENFNEHSVAPQARLLMNTDPMLTQNTDIYHIQNQQTYDCGSLSGFGVNNQPCQQTFNNNNNDVQYVTILDAIEIIPPDITNQEVVINETSPDASTEPESSNDLNYPISFGDLSLTDMFDADYLDSLLNSDQLSSDSGGQVCLSTKRGNVSDSSGSQEADRAVVNQMAKSLNNIIKIIQTKNDDNSKVMIKSLEDLLKLRLANGDTFLHMALPTRQPLFIYIVNAVRRFDIANLLNIRNHNLQTILHLAITADMPDVINLLVSKGCDPMLEDLEGNNVFHYTMICNNGLGPLLEAVKVNNVPYDLNAFNYDKQTPLHLAVIYKNAESAQLLLKEGANYKALDNEGRSPLHLAVYDDCLSVVRELLVYMQTEDINEEDGQGRNPLQIACSSELRDNTEEIIKLLLKHKADPMKEGKLQSPWHLVKSKPVLRKIFNKYMNEPSNVEDDVTSDEYQSADEESD